MAGAEDVDTGVAVDRFVPSPSPGALLAADGAALPAPGRPALLAAFAFAASPLTVRHAFTGATVTAPVAEMGTLHVAAEIRAARHLSLGLGVPVVVLARGDRLRDLGAGDERALEAGRIGDVRLRARVLLVGGRRGLSLVAGIAVTIPGGAEEHFGAAAGPTVEPRLSLSLSRGLFSAVADAGAFLAAERRLLDVRLGPALHLAAGAAFTLFRRAAVQPRATVEIEAWIGGPGDRPAEVRAALGLVFRGGLSVDAGAGLGLDHDVAAPRARALVLLRWASPAIR